MVEVFCASAGLPNGQQGRELQPSSGVYVHPLTGQHANYMYSNIPALYNVDFIYRESPPILHLTYSNFLFTAPPFLLVLSPKNFANIAPLPKI